jgi:hypothetical protein
MSLFWAESDIASAFPELGDIAQAHVGSRTPDALNCYRQLDAGAFVVRNRRHDAGYASITVPLFRWPCCTFRFRCYIRCPPGIGVCEQPCFRQFLRVLWFGFAGMAVSDPF